jgi:hypothetical protein
MDHAFTDPDVYGRGFDPVFGKGAGEITIKEAKLKLKAIRDANSDLRINDYVDYDLYGRGDPRIFGPGSDIANRQEAAQALSKGQTYKEHRIGTTSFPSASKVLLRLSSFNKQDAGIIVKSQEVDRTDPNLKIERVPSLGNCGKSEAESLSRSMSTMEERQPSAGRAILVEPPPFKRAELEAENAKHLLRFSSEKQEHMQPDLITSFSHPPSRTQLNKVPLDCEPRPNMARDASRSLGSEHSVPLQMKIKDGFPESASKFREATHLNSATISCYETQLEPDVVKKEPVPYVNIDGQSDNSIDRLSIASAKPVIPLDLSSPITPENDCKNGFQYAMVTPQEEQRRTTRLFEEPQITDVNPPAPQKTSSAHEVGLDLDSDETAMLNGRHSETGDLNSTPRHFMEAFDDAEASHPLSGQKFADAEITIVSNKSKVQESAKLENDSAIQLMAFKLVTNTSVTNDEIAADVSREHESCGGTAIKSEDDGTSSQFQADTADTASSAMCLGKLNNMEQATSSSPSFPMMGTKSGSLSTNGMDTPTVPILNENESHANDIAVAASTTQGSSESDIVAEESSGSLDSSDIIDSSEIIDSSDSGQASYENIEATRNQAQRSSHTTSDLENSSNTEFDSSQPDEGAGLSSDGELASSSDTVENSSESGHASEKSGN